MFDFVRKHTKIMMALMFMLIIPAFVLVGVDGYRRMNEGGASVAKVGSHSITQSEWDAAHKREVDRLRASMPNLDAKMLESPQARYITLERLVRDQVIAQATTDSLLNISDARLARELQQNPTIGALRKPDGSLDMERYRQLAASQGLTPEGFEARVRQDLSERQVEAGFGATVFAPKALADVTLNAFFERRDVQIARFTPAQFFTKVSLSDADISAYYQANQALFQAAESADVEYLVLDLEAVKKMIVVNEADLKTYYEQNATRLSSKEERRASHILINAPKDMKSAERQKAKETAQALLAKVKSNPETFATLASKNSQDPGSAAKGGDLDFFARGAMVKPFEDAAFTMKKGEISDLVESDFGFHILKLTDIKAPAQASFESLRPGLEAELKTQQAQRKFAELAEVFSNGVYEQADSLKPMAERLKLEVKTANGLRRTPQPGAEGVLVNPKLLAALFSSDATEKKRNTEAIETGASQLVSARIARYSPAHTLPLDEVRNAVKDRLMLSRATELAKKEGTANLATWKTNATGATVGESVLVSRDQTSAVKGPLLGAIMRADTAALPSWVGVDLGEQGYAVVRVNKVLARNTPATETAAQEYAQYSQWLANAELQSYYQLLKERFKVKISVPRPSAETTLAAAAQ